MSPHDATAPRTDTVSSSPSSQRAATVRTLVCLALVYVIWGSTYLALRVVVEGLPVFLSGGSRYAFAGFVLFVFLRARGAPWPTWRQWVLSLPVGVLLFVVGNAFVALAEKEVPSALAALVCGAVPLCGALMGMVAGERPSKQEVLGLVIGFGGVFAMTVGALRSAHMAGVLLLLAPIGWALGSTLAKRWPLPKGLMAAALQMLTGGIALLLIGIARSEVWPSNAPSSSLWALLYLVVFGSLIAFSAFSVLLRTTPMSIALSNAYVNPVIAVALGAWLAGERLSPGTLAGATLVVGGVALLVTAKRGVPKQPA